MALSLATNHGSRRGCALSACDVFVATGEARKQEATDASEPLKNVMVLLRIWCGGGGGGRGYRSYIRRIRSSGEKVNIKRLYRSPPLDRRFVYDLQEGGGKNKKKTGGIHDGSSFASRGNPSHDRGEEEKEKKNETVADWRGKASRFVGIVQPLYLSRGPGFPRVHRAAAGCKKNNKILRAQKDEDVVKSFASKHSGLDRQHFPLRRNVGKLGVVALTGKYWTDTFFKMNTRNYCWPRLGCLGSPSNTTSARVRAVDGSQKNRKKEKNELKNSQNELFFRLPAAEGFIITKAGRMTPCQARNARKQTL